MLPHSSWYSVQKILCKGGLEETEIDRIIDEPNTAERWWETDVCCQKNFEALTRLTRICFSPSFPITTSILMFTFLCISGWTKARSQTRSKKHPILLRALWIHSKVRNGSGNGGGVLLGCMPLVS